MLYAPLLPKAGGVIRRINLLLTCVCSNKLTNWAMIRYTSKCRCKCILSQWNSTDKLENTKGLFFCSGNSLLYLDPKHCLILKVHRHNRKTPLTYKYNLIIFKKILEKYFNETVVIDLALHSRQTDSCCLGFMLKNYNCHLSPVYAI